jgi:hypothetical protein
MPTTLNVVVLFKEITDNFSTTNFTKTQSMLCTLAKGYASPWVSPPPFYLHAATARREQIIDLYIEWILYTGLLPHRVA